MNDLFHIRKNRSLKEIKLPLHQQTQKPTNFLLPSRSAHPSDHTFVNFKKNCKLEPLLQKADKKVKTNKDIIVSLQNTQPVDIRALGKRSQSKNQTSFLTPLLTYHDKKVEPQKENKQILINQIANSHINRFQLTKTLKGERIKTSQNHQAEIKEKVQLIDRLQKIYNKQSKGVIIDNCKTYDITKKINKTSCDAHEEKIKKGNFTKKLKKQTVQIKDTYNSDKFINTVQIKRCVSPIKTKTHLQTLWQNCSTIKQHNSKDSSFISQNILQQFDFNKQEEEAPQKHVQQNGDRNLFINVQKIRKKFPQNFFK